MCYTVKIDLTREELERRFGARFRDPDSYTTGTRIKAFDLPKLPVICNDDPEEIRLYTWGLIPYWIKDPKTAGEIRMKTFNARCESLLEKASYKHLLGCRRCLVLVSGFYEWQTAGKKKIPYFIGLNGEPAIALAGLYDSWASPSTGEILNTFTVITTKANPMLEVIHNLKKRMPVILDDKDQKRWLDTKSDPLNCGFFVPFPENRMFSEMLS